MRAFSTLKTHMTQHLKCLGCGRIYFEVAAEYARAEVASVLALGPNSGHATPSFERYVRCLDCGAASATFIPIAEQDVPPGRTIQAVVVA